MTVTDQCMPMAKCFGKYLKPSPFNPAMSSAVESINANPREAERFAAALSSRDEAEVEKIFHENGFAETQNLTVIRPSAAKSKCKHWKIIRIWINPDDGGTYCEMVCTD
jgi:hypothetical protein